MIKKYLTGAVVAAGMIIGASAANAGVIDFTGASSSSGSNTFGFMGDDGTGVVASVLTGNVGGTTFYGGTLQHSGYGLNICGDTQWYGCGENHEIDGYYNEGVKLTFDKEVSIDKITFNYIDGDDRVIYRSGAGSWSDVAIPGDGNLTIGPALLGTIFDICAVWDARSGRYQADFKLASVEYTVSAVPLPPAVLMFGAALLGLGWVKRRKQAA